MSERPSLSQYFGTDDGDVDAKDLQEVSDKINNINLNENKDVKNEPEVCRMFTETPTQPKDPTAAFFDLIGNPTSNLNNSGIVNDFNLPNTEVVSCS